MTETRWFPSPHKNMEAAERQFVQHYGSAAVTNKYLKVAVICLSTALLGSSAINVKLVSKPSDKIIVRIDKLGRPEATKFESDEYHPQENELKYFLTQFVQNHYGRMRNTVRDNYPRSLYFLDSSLADTLIQANQKNKVIETFLVNPTEEVEIEVDQVILEEVRKPPYKASVDFYRIYYSLAHQELRRERYVGTFLFVIRPDVPNSIIPINPLGFTITYLREDQAFK